MDNTSTIERLVKYFGSQSGLAIAAGVKQPTVWSWVNGKQQPGPKAVLRIERATDGAFSRYELRDDAEQLWPRETIAA